MKRLVAALTLQLGCTAEVLPGPEHRESEISRSEVDLPLQPAGLMPVWRTGDAWIVRYHFEWERRRTGEVLRIGAMEVLDEDWEYRVEWIAGGYVSITATHVSSTPRGARHLEGTTRLRYRMNAELVEIAMPRDKHRITVGPKVHFPRVFWEDDDSGRNAWPQFPLVEGPLVALDQGYKEVFEQSVTPEDRGVRVTLTRRYEQDEEGLEDIVPPREVVQTMEQIWEPNRPWWSSIRIYSGDSLHVQGDVIEWRPAKP